MFNETIKNTPQNIYTTVLYFSHFSHFVDNIQQKISKYMKIYMNLHQSFECLKLHIALVTNV